MTSRALARNSCGLGLELEILRRFPEVIQNQQPVFVRQVIEHLFRVLSQPVADDVEMSIAVQPEIRLQPSRSMRLRASSYPSCRLGRQWGTPFTRMTR